MAHPDVVLVTPDDTPIGTAPKGTVHTADTPLHRAFSCHIFHGDDVLLSRRALGKKTWPGVWTNAFCGHPADGEAREQALVRHAAFELGITIDTGNIRPLIPDFAYRAVDASGVAEHEICPVFGVEAAVDPRPNADEVMDTAWVPTETLDRIVAEAPGLVSPWLALQWAEYRGLAIPHGLAATRL